VGCRWVLLTRNETQCQAIFVLKLAQRPRYPGHPMEKPDPYGDWVLFPTQKGDATSANSSDEELIAAARGAWPHVLAQAQKEFHKKELGPDSASFARQIWESVLRSVARTRQRNSNYRPPISDLESYLIGAFHHRFNRTLVREQRRLETIELVSSSFDLERIKSARKHRPTNYALMSPGNLRGSLSKPGNTGARSFTPMCLVRISPTTLRKSVVRTRSRPSLS